MTNFMRVLLALGLAGLGSVALAQSCNPTEPRTDSGATFAAFAALERLEVRSGRPGAQDWEWGLGTNTQQTGSFAKSYLDWVSGRVLTYTLSYDGAGAGSFTVYDGATPLATQTWNDPAKPLRAGNALKLYVKSTADAGTATVQVTTATLNGLPAAGSIQTAGNSQFSEQTLYWYFPAMTGGFTITGTVTLTFSGANPPQGSRLNFLVTAGTVTCQQASTPPGLYFVHVDHLNTPRLVSNGQQQAVWRWEQQEPFGVNAPDENPSSLGAFEFPLRFPGQYADKETNLYYNYFRDYDPLTGRYEESDPIGLKGGLNTYSYANGNAVLYVDPDGLAVYGSAQGSGGGWGGGYVTVTCGDECNKIRRFHYLKVCRGFAMRGGSLSAGVVSNMNGAQCRPETFAGYSGEIGAGVGGFGAEAGFGLSGSYFPTGLSGVNTVGIGVAVPGWSALLCFYKFLGEW